VLQAIPTSNRYGLVTYDHLIRELDRGYFKQPFESVARYDAERQDHGVLHYRFPGKDSLLDVYQRVSAFLVQLHLYIGSGRVGRQDTVVLVGHAGMFKQMIGRIQGLSGDVADAMNIPNCAVHGILLLLSSPPHNVMLLSCESKSHGCCLQGSKPPITLSHIHTRTRTHASTHVPYKQYTHALSLPLSCACL
jgi:hypothetical protein